MPAFDLALCLRMVGRAAKVSPRWLEDEALVERVLVTNPAGLYGFD
jgi:hypothetical protein